MNLLENLSLSEALIEEKVEAKVERRLVKKEKTKANNLESKAAFRPSMRSSSNSTKCVAVDKSTLPFRDTTNIRLARPKLTNSKGPGMYQNEVGRE